LKGALKINMPSASGSRWLVGTTMEVNRQDRFQSWRIGVVLA